MSYQPIDIDRTGHPILTLPPADQVRIRPGVAAGPDWAVMQWGPIAAYPDPDWLMHLQAEATRALVDMGYADECATPETLARQGGAA